MRAKEEIMLNRNATSAQFKILEVLCDIRDILATFINTQVEENKK